MSDWPAFRFEKEMTEPVARWLESEGYECAFEYGMSHGICDIIACKFDLEKVKARVRIRRKTPLTWSERTIYATLACNPGLTYAEIANPYVRDSAYIHAISALLKKGMVYEEFKKFRTTEIRWFPCHEEVIAVELKLNDIAGVRGQASSNYYHANRSYAAMPEGRIKKMRPATIKGFEEKGLGLISVAMGGCKIIVKPEFKKHTDHCYCNEIRCAEAVWGKIAKHFDKEGARR